MCEWRHAFHAETAVEATAIYLLGLLHMAAGQVASFLKRPGVFGLQEPVWTQLCA